jgi:hypothetical protein
MLLCRVLLRERVHSPLGGYLYRPRRLGPAGYPPSSH